MVLGSIGFGGVRHQPQITETKQEAEPEVNKTQTSEESTNTTSTTTNNNSVAKSEPTLAPVSSEPSQSVSASRNIVTTADAKSIVDAMLDTTQSEGMARQAAIEAQASQQTQSLIDGIAVVRTTAAQTVLAAEGNTTGSVDPTGEEPSSRASVSTEKAEA